MAKLVPLETPAPTQRKRMGFMAGQITVPDAQTFNRLAEDEMAALFGSQA